MLLPVMLFAILKIGFSICMFLQNRYMEEYSIPINSEAVVCRCSSKLRKLHRKTPVLENLFNKKRLLKRCFPVKSAKLLRTSFFTKHSGGCSRKLKYRKKHYPGGLKRGTKRLNMKNV